MKQNILKSRDLKSGDILLCYSADLQDTDDEMKCGYAHVALCSGGDKIFEANAGGVRETTVDQLLEGYGHIAVIRAPGTWSEARVRKLDDFLQSQVGKPFNRVGMYKVQKRKETLRVEAMARVHGYFEGTETSPVAERNQYFCSELVTSAFIAVKIINESAAVLLSPEVFSPEGLGKDKLFGFFEGYVIPYASYQVPANDHFRTSV